MNPAVKEVLEASGFEKLNPVQEEAVRAGVAEGGSFVIAAPTASGKTVIAEIASMAAIKMGKKVLYIVPLRALASEKYREFKEKYGPMGIKVAISMGDMDSSDPWLESFDIIISTSEKVDSLLRHGIGWIDSVGLVIADELHLIDSPDRGPTLEIVLTRLRNTNASILGLSATISNHEELAGWLGATPVKSHWRPVKLYKGVCYDKEISYHPERRLSLQTDSPLSEIVENTLDRNKQAIVFTLTRKGAESMADKMGAVVRGKLKGEETKKLDEVTRKVLGSIDNPTRQCKRLAECVKNGSAFHHAGLTNGQRSAIEDAFREGCIKIICATPTLAAGVNLPAYRIIIRDLKRFSSFRGMDFMPALEVEQMVGRAGRPKYDSEGEGILLPKNKGEAEFAWNNYIIGETERITSKLGVEPVLRMHVLSLIASGVTPTRQSLFDFFSKTFYAYQYENLSHIRGILERIILMLQEFGFVHASDTKGSPFKRASEGEKNSSLKATNIGRRVSELYIDPITANKLIRNSGRENVMGLFPVLQAISNTIEMKPLVGIRKKDEGKGGVVTMALLEEEGNLLESVPNEWDYEYEDFLKSIKTAALLRSWCNESREGELLEEFGVTPGELRGRLERAEWLLYAFQELLLLTGKMDSLKDIKKARLRIKYGIREELLPFVKLKGIGRARARMIYNAGFKKISDMRNAPVQSLERVVGTSIAADIKSQLGEL